MKLSTYYTDNPEVHARAGQAAYDEMTARLGNAVLRAVKKINQQARRNEYRQQMTESLITEIFGILSRAANAEENRLNYAYREDELSRQAKKELAMRLENSRGGDWDLEH